MVTIAQISDTHILARSTEQPVGESRAENLRRCVADINRLRPRPDVVVHTGDTVQHGQPEEYGHLRDILSDLEVPFYLIPGNRDCRDGLRAAFRDHAHLEAGGDFLHYAVEDYAVRLVGLDSTAPGERKGRFCEQRVAWLDATLAEVPEKPTVLFIHHPPFDVGDHYVGGYRVPQEAEELASVVGRYPQVARLLCGHVHSPVEQRWAGTQATIMPSVAVDVRKGVDTAAANGWPIYHLHELSDAASLVSESRIVKDQPAHPVSRGRSPEEGQKPGRI